MASMFLPRARSHDDDRKMETKMIKKKEEDFDASVVVVVLEPRRHLQKSQLHVKLFLVFRRLA